HAHIVSPLSDGQSKLRVSDDKIWEAFSFNNFNVRSADPSIGLLNYYMTGDVSNMFIADGEYSVSLDTTISSKLFDKKDVVALELLQLYEKLFIPTLEKQPWFPVYRHSISDLFVRQ
ncbi:MAG TPA: hypothetical protein VK158_00245, partial [Acidobacteriota bacterium]|nr:hypothetical protein [Acidobacteriota bacterium]